jgi:hypothetical protein
MRRWASRERAVNDDDTDIGPSGTLVIEPERNPAAAKRSLTAEDEDPATRVAAPGPPTPPLPTSPTLELQTPPVGGVSGTLQMGAITNVAINLPPGTESALRPSFGALPSGDPRETTRVNPTHAPSKLLPLFVGAAVALGVGGVGLYLAFRGNPSSKLLHQTSPASMALDDEGEHSPEPSAVAPPAGSATTATPASLPDIDQRAKAALEKLREGIKSCVETTIHKLPGTSPAVPESLAWFKHGPYVSLKRDWASPFFSCTRFSIDDPMPFAIQWQADRDGTHGTGIAWVDENNDGVADRAYAFTATFTSGSISTTDVEPTDPTRAIVRPN